MSYDSAVFVQPVSCLQTMPVRGGDRLDPASRCNSTHIHALGKVALENLQDLGESLVEFGQAVRSLVCCCCADETEHEAVPVKHWSKHVTQLHSDGDLGFSQEYEVWIIL